MALCRCLELHAWPAGKTRTYSAYVHPVGYPETALICGLCDRPGVLWLDTSEMAAYERGQRVFVGPNAFTRMKASDEGLRRRHQSRLLHLLVAGCGLPLLTDPRWLVEGQSHRGRSISAGAELAAVCFAPVVHGDTVKDRLARIRVPTAGEHGAVPTMPDG